MGKRCPGCGIILEYLPEKDIYFCPICDKDIKNITKEDQKSFYESIKNQHL